MALLTTLLEANGYCKLCLSTQGPLNSNFKVNSGCTNQVEMKPNRKQISLLLRGTRKDTT